MDTSSISEVKSVHSDEEANELIKQGWVLLHAGTAYVSNASSPYFLNDNDAGFQRPHIVYVLGLPRKPFTE